MSESRLFFTGNTLEQAVMSAARHYSLDPDELAYERIERKAGFLRVRRRVVIRVDPEHPARDPNAAPVEKLARAAEPEALPGPEPAPKAAASVGVPPGVADEDEPADLEPKAPPRSARPEAPEREVRPSRRRGRRRNASGDGGERSERAPSPETPAVAEPRSAEPPRGRRRRGRSAGGSESESHADADLSFEVDSQPDLDPEGEFEEDYDGEPRPELPPAHGPAAEAAADCAVQLARLADLDLEIEVFRGEDQLEVELAGEDQELLVRGEGRLLLAIQHLLPRLMQGELGEMAPCRVDSCGFRDRRVASLRRLAERTAEEVRRRGKPRTLRSMSPADRRTVHLALQDDDSVTTDSAGDGFYKRVTVRPT